MAHCIIFLYFPSPTICGTSQTVYWKANHASAMHLGISHNTMECREWLWVGD